MPTQPRAPEELSETDSDPARDASDSVDSFVRAAVGMSEPPALAEPPPLLPGDVVADRFVIYRRAGRGGMGSVYECEDRLLGQPAALKVMLRHGPGGATRFTREAEVLAELSHPAIVRYVAHGETARGLRFLAMDWLDGEDLQERLARAAVATSEALLLVRRVAEGLAAAHAKGVVHRDIKPSNLFLCGGEPGQVKIIDFGVARLEAGATALTQPGTALGTVGYMAPEQASGATDVDASADVYAVGCVLFECLTGRPVFEGPRSLMLAKVIGSPPRRPSAVRPELGDRFDALLTRLLSKDRRDRPRDGAELRCALEALE